MKLQTHLPASQRQSAFTLMEVLVAMALMAVVVPVVFQGLHVASLAGEVSQRKALAVRIGDRVLNEALLAGQTASANSGAEKAGVYDFSWQIKDDAWNELTSLPTLSTPNGVNQSGVSSTVIHQLSVDVNYVVQGKNYSVHLATLVNKLQQ